MTLSKNKTILITGAGGFIGSHLAELCVQEGYKVKAFLHYNSQNNRGWLENSDYRDDIEFVAGDVRDYDAVCDALEGCGSVFHLAALIGIPYSYRSPLAYIRTNIEGTYNILEAAKNQQLDNVVVTSTSETYGTAQYVPIDEKHPSVGQSPYAASKVAADQLAVSYHRSFGLPVKIIRPFNTYGPRQSARAIIPTIITQFLNGQLQLKLGNLTPTRDFTYVQDTIKGILAVAQAEQLVGEATNIGMNHEVSIGDLVGLVGRILGKDINVEREEKRVRPGNSEVERLMCDNSKIKEATGWEPEYTLEQGLQETIDFLEGHVEIYKSEIYNV